MSQERSGEEGAGQAESGLVRRECARGFMLRLPLALLPDSHFARQMFFFPPSQGACSQAIQHSQR